MNRNKKIDFKEQLFEALRYIKESRNFIYFVILLFFASTILGFFFSNDLRFIDEILRNILDKTQDLGTFEITLFILQNNLQSAFLGFIFGIVFGVFPIFNAITNGVVLGYVFSRTYEITGIADFWRILPHGIFELPAIFIALGLGLKFGTIWFSKNKTTSLKERFYQSINVFLMIIVPLLVIAAIIEGLLIGFLR